MDTFGFRGPGCADHARNRGFVFFQEVRIWHTLGGDVIGNGTNVENIEGHIGAARLDMHHTPFPKGMPNPELVKDIGVINAHVHKT